MTVANLDYFLTVNKELLGNIQNLLGFGSLPPLPEIPQIKQNTAKNKNKPRAMSGNETQSVLNIPQNMPRRERSQTESQLIIPLQYLPPPVSKVKPWGEGQIVAKSFDQLQSEETKSPLKINKWASSKENIEKPLNFKELQIEEKNFQELDEALVLIALMESMEK